MRRIKKLGIRAVALFLALNVGCFGVFPTNSAHAALLPAPLNTVQLPSDLNDFHLPTILGKIDDLRVSPNARTIILIQDAHAIPDAQASIQKTIAYLQETYGIGHVAVEGAANRLDSTLFKSFPDKVILKKIFKEYFDRGELTGTSAAALFNKNNEVYEGAENWAIYEEGLALYLEAYEKQAGILRFIDSEKQKLEEAKINHYSERLMIADTLIVRFYLDKADVLSTLKGLAEIEAPPAGSDLELMLAESKSSGDDSSDIEIELKRISEEVSRSFSQLQSNEKEQKKFNEKRQEFATGQLTAQAFAVFLKSFGARNGIAVKFSKELGQSAGQQLRLEQIEGTKFFRDFKVYARQLKQNLFETDEQKLIDQQYSQLELLQRLALMKLDQEDWQQLVSGDIAVENAAFRDDLLPAVAFYQNAKKRDEILFKNLIQQMDKTKTSAGILVAGGFHTEGLTRYLTEAGMSYVVIMPSIRKLPDVSHYSEQMQGKVSWQNELKVEDGKIDLYAAFVRYTRDRLLMVPGTARTGSQNQSLNVPGTILKNWRDQILRDLAAEGRLAQAKEYTRFLDEVMDSEGQTDGLRELWLKNAETFMGNIRELKASDQLTQANVAKLFSPSSLAAAHPANAIAAGSFLGVRSETRRFDLSSARALLPLPSDTEMISAATGRSEVRRGYSSVIRAGTALIIIAGGLAAYHLGTSYDPGKGGERPAMETWQVPQQEQTFTIEAGLRSDAADETQVVLQNMRVWNQSLVTRLKALSDRTDVSGELQDFAAAVVRVIQTIPFVHWDKPYAAASDGKIYVNAHSMTDQGTYDATLIHEALHAAFRYGYLNSDLIPSDQEVTSGFTSVDDFSLYFWPGEEGWVIKNTNELLELLGESLKTMTGQAGKIALLDGDWRTLDWLKERVSDPKEAPEKINFYVKLLPLIANGQTGSFLQQAPLSVREEAEEWLASLQQRLDEDPNAFYPVVAAGIKAAGDVNEYLRTNGPVAYDRSRRSEVRVSSSTSNPRVLVPDNSFEVLEFLSKYTHQNPSDLLAVFGDLLLKDARGVAFFERLMNLTKNPLKAARLADYADLVVHARENDGLLTYEGRDGQQTFSIPYALLEDGFLKWVLGARIQSKDLAQAYALYIENESKKTTEGKLSLNDLRAKLKAQGDPQAAVSFREEIWHSLTQASAFIDRPVVDIRSDALIDAIRGYGLDPDKVQFRADSDEDGIITVEILTKDRLFISEAVKNRQAEVKQLLEQQSRLKDDSLSERSRLVLPRELNVDDISTPDQPVPIGFVIASQSSEGAYVGILQPYLRAGRREYPAVYEFVENYMRILARALLDQPEQFFKMPGAASRVYFSTPSTHLAVKRDLSSYTAIGIYYELLKELGLVAFPLETPLTLGNLRTGYTAYALPPAGTAAPEESVGLSEVRAEIGSVAVRIDKSEVFVESQDRREKFSGQGNSLYRPVYEQLEALIKTKVKDATLASNLLKKLAQPSGVFVGNWRDTEGFKIVLREILVNSYRSIRENNSNSSGRIEIRVVLENDLLKILIADDGKGFYNKNGKPLSEKQINRFFEEGVTTKKGFEVKEGLVGNGLYRSRYLIEKGSLQGTLKASNRPNGERGAVFEVAIPLNAESRSEVRTEGQSQKSLFERFGTDVLTPDELVQVAFQLLSNRNLGIVLPGEVSPANAARAVLRGLEMAKNDKVLEKQITSFILSVTDPASLSDTVEAEVKAVIASLERIAPDAALEIGALLPETREQISPEFITALIQTIKQRSIVDGVLAAGKGSAISQFKETLQGIVGIRQIQPNRAPLIFNGQSKVPLVYGADKGVIEQVYQSLHENFFPVSASTSVDDDPFIRNYVEVLKVVAAIHTADLLKGNPQLLTNPETLKQALFERLFLAENQLTSMLKVTGQGIGIDSTLARVYLTWKAAEAAARAA